MGPRRGWRGRAQLGVLYTLNLLLCTTNTFKVGKDGGASIEESPRANGQNRSISSKHLLIKKLDTNF